MSNRYCTLRRVRSCFTRYGIRATVHEATELSLCAESKSGNGGYHHRGQSLGYAADECTLSFYGADGRKVRSEALAWCKALGAIEVRPCCHVSSFMRLSPPVDSISRVH